jgi:hypothetical protein
MRFFYELTYFIEMKDDFLSTTMRNDSTYFENKKEAELNENILRWEHRNERDPEIIESEVCFFRQVLRLSGGSSCADEDSFFRMISNNCIEIDESVKVIRKNDLKGLKSLTEVRFSFDNHLRQICGIEECPSLCRIEIPSSVEIIESRGFSQCISLNEIVFSPDRRLKRISGFWYCTSLCRIEIPSSVVAIGAKGFRGCTSLNEVIFSSDSHLRHISGFLQCRSLCRIEIPSSVELIASYGFYRCISLNEVIFSPDSHLRRISGFCHCTSLCRIEIPSSVEVISDAGFSFCTSLHVVIIRSGCRMSDNRGLRQLKPFLVYEDDDVKKSRRMVHLGTGERRNN